MMHLLRLGDNFEIRILKLFTRAASNFDLILYELSKDC